MRLKDGTAGAEGAEDQNTGAEGAEDQNAGAEGAEDNKGDEAPKGLLDHADNQQAAEGEGDDAGKGEEGDDKPAAPFRPEGLPDHLAGENDRETIEKLNKAYLGARAQISEGTQGKAPKTSDDYKVELADDLGLPVDAEGAADKPVIDALRTAAHANGLTQGQFNGVLNDTLRSLVASGLIDDPYDAAREFDVLGGKEAAMPVINALVDWGKGLVKQGMLSEDDFSEYKIMAGTGRGARVMVVLREMTGEPPINLHTAPSGLPSKDELDAMIGDDRYGVDKAFTKKVEGLFNQVYSTAPAS